MGTRIHIYIIYFTIPQCTSVMQKHVGTHNPKKLLLKTTKKLQKISCSIEKNYKFCNYFFLTNIGWLGWSNRKII